MSDKPYQDLVLHSVIGFAMCVSGVLAVAAAGAAFYWSVQAFFIPWVGLLLTLGFAVLVLVGLVLGVCFLWSGANVFLDGIKDHRSNKRRASAN